MASRRFPRLARVRLLVNIRSVSILLKPGRSVLEVLGTVVTGSGWARHIALNSNNPKQFNSQKNRFKMHFFVDALTLDTRPLVIACMSELPRVGTNRDIECWM
jgi:hypothetical protein